MPMVDRGRHAVLVRVPASRPEAVAPGPGHSLGGPRLRGSQPICDGLPYSTITKMRVRSGTSTRPTTTPTLTSVATLFCWPAACARYPTNVPPAASGCWRLSPEPRPWNSSSELPCSTLRTFAADGTPHHAGVIEELVAVRERGEQAWLDDQLKRWACPQCGTHSEWYSKACVSCGTSVPALEE